MVERHDLREQEQNYRGQHAGAISAKGEIITHIIFVASTASPDSTNTLSAAKATHLPSPCLALKGRSRSRETVVDRARRTRSATTMVGLSLDAQHFGRLSAKALEIKLSELRTGPLVRRSADLRQSPRERLLPSAPRQGERQMGRLRALSVFVGIGLAVLATKMIG